MLYYGALITQVYTRKYILITTQNDIDNMRNIFHVFAHSFKCHVVIIGIEFYAGFPLNLELPSMTRKFCIFMLSFATKLLAHLRSHISDFFSLLPAVHDSYFYSNKS